MTQVHLQTKYLNQPVTPQFSTYRADGSIAMQLVGEDGVRLALATVCLVDSGERPAEGHLFIKDWSENEGMVAGLQAAGIIGAPTRTIPLAHDAIAYEAPLLWETASDE